MTILKYFLVFLSISLFSNNLLAKETKYSCKPQSAAAVRSNGIQVFKISGKEKPVEITIKDGEAHTRATRRLYWRLRLTDLTDQILSHRRLD